MEKNFDASEEQTKKKIEKDETVLYEEQQIGRYRILTLLGQGGMGIVYKAWDSRLDRTVALKVLPAEIARKNEAIQRFEREAKYCARLRHPHIVSLHDFEHADNTYFLTMDFIDGVSLDHLLKEENLSVTKSCQMLLEILDAVGYAHAQGIIHRDLKPSNILVDKQGKAYITDFGLAKALTEDTQISKPGSIIGTPSYMSPEQVNADSANLIDRQSDIYSIGTIFYEMLVGKKLVESDSLMTVFYKILHEDIQNISGNNPGITVELEEICKKALAKNKKDRYVSADAMAVDIKNYLAGTSAIQKKKTVRLNWRLLVAGTLACLFLLGLGLALKFIFPASSHPAHTPAVSHAVAPMQTQDIPMLWTLDKWQACWDGKNNWLDFSQDTWLYLPHDVQTKYAKAYQEWYARKLGIYTEKQFSIHGTDFLMVLIPPGKFAIGYQHHKVIISKPFWMGKYEVSQGEWSKIMGKNPAGYRSVGYQAPVEQVSRFDCDKFCQTTGFLLPTESQWEYAYRAGTTGECYWGNKEEIADYAWYLDNSMQSSHPRGQKRPNPWGLYDMAGNVWEWCRDRFGEYPTTDVTDPTGPDQGSHFVVRGGCCNGNAEFCMAPKRYKFEANFIYWILGLRIIKPVS